MSDLHTLGRWLADRARLTPAKAAIEENGRVLSYAELDERAGALAARLQRAGYVAGDRIATLTHNSADHVVLLFACARARLVLVPMSWRLNAEELAYQLRHSRAALLLVQPDHAEQARAALGHLETPPAVELLGTQGVELHVPRPVRSEVVEAGTEPSLEPPRDDDPLLLVYTSGTSRAPKGAVLTHANCFWTNLSFAGLAGLSADDVVLAVLPQFHVGGWNIQPLLAWWMGATVVLERDFDAGRTLELIEQRRITTMMGVPTMYQRMAEHPRFAETDLASLRYAVVGGATAPEDLLRTWNARGVRLLQGYGLTEAGPNVLALPAAETCERVGSVGKPYPYVDVAVRDPSTGRVLHGAASGELLVRGPAVFAGYYRDDDATADVLTDGWLRTGDYVERDAEGYYRVVDRLDDMFVSGGENISPAEVEAALLSHPDVVDAAVVGVPDKRWGRVGHAFVVRRPGAELTAEALVAYCRTRLASFKAPREVTFLDALPRTPLHKLRRRALAADGGIR